MTDSCPVVRLQLGSNPAVPCIFGLRCVLHDYREKSVSLTNAMVVLTVPVPGIIVWPVRSDCAAAALSLHRRASACVIVIMLRT